MPRLWLPHLCRSFRDRSVVVSGGGGGIRFVRASGLFHSIKSELHGNNLFLVVAVVGWFAI